MDKSVAVRFFKVKRLSDDRPSLASLLEVIGNVNQPEDREKLLAQNYTVRLEIFDKEGTDYVVGELTRIQTTNMPSHISKGKRSKLDQVNRLGHSVIFRLNHKKGILGLQYDGRLLAPFRFFQYVSMWDLTAQYTREPIIREDMWERFERGSPRYLEVGIANPKDLSSLGGDADAILSATNRMGKAYEAPGIVVRMTMGHQKGGLASSVKGMVSDLLRRRAEGTIELSSLKAKSATDEGNDGINLLAEVMEYREELQLHDRDPDVNYEIKMQYLKRCMSHVG